MQRHIIWPFTILAAQLWFSDRASSSGLATGDVYPIVEARTGRFRGRFVVHFQDTLRLQCKEEIVALDGAIATPPKVVAGSHCELPQLRLGRQAPSPEVVRKGRWGVAFPDSFSAHGGKPWYRTVTASGLSPKHALSWGDVMVASVMDMRLTAESVIVFARVVRDLNKVRQVNSQTFLLGQANEKVGVYCFQRDTSALREVIELGGVGIANEMGDFPLISEVVSLSDSEFAVAYISDKSELRYIVIDGRTSKAINVGLGDAGTGSFNVSMAAIGRRLLIAFHSFKSGEGKNSVKLVSVGVP